MGTLIPGREDSSEDVLTTALYIHSGEAVHHGNRKALETREALLRDAELCECLFMLMCACTHSHWKRGGAKTHQTCTQTGAGIRSIPVGPPFLLGQLQSFSSETRALSESQDTQVPIHSTLLSLRPCTCKDLTDHLCEACATGVPILCSSSLASGWSANPTCSSLTMTFQP